jgi:hypothetical protein
MTSVSITALKANPSSAISASFDYPVAIKNREKVQSYLIGKVLFEKMVSFIEDNIDQKAVKEADYKNAVSLDDVIKDLGLE